MAKHTAKRLDFDIDRYLNPWVPKSQLHKLPRWVSWWLGYREGASQEIGSVLVWWWSSFGAFCGISVVSAVYRWAPGVSNHDLPVVFASLGASAILEYNTVQSPLAQPRNSILGHSLSAIVGVAVAKLFMLHPDYDDIRWIAGAMCCGLSSAIMGMTNTVHPPGGATALLAAVDPTTIALGWWFVPLIMLGSVLITAVACVVNNMQRQFPVYWWSPKETSTKAVITDEEALPPKAIDDDIVKVHTEFKQSVFIDADHLILPQGLALAWEEDRVLQVLRERLRALRDGDAHVRQDSTVQMEKEGTDGEESDGTGT